MQSNIIVKMENIYKYFGDVCANNNINFEIEKGKIHAIVGENGAGKTTLMNMLYGVFEPTSGEIYINGEKVRLNSPKKAISLGIGMVHQHFQLVPEFTVAENIFLGHEPINGLRVIDKKKMIAETKEISKRYGLAVDPDKRVCDLSVGLLQRVEILKVLSRGAEIIILDEPTAVLTPLECEELFKVLEKMAADNKTIILITHKLKEVMQIADDVTVLRHGCITGNIEKKNTNEMQLAKMMVERNFQWESYEKLDLKNDIVALQIKNLSVKDAFGVEKIKKICLDIKQGEILTVAGVEGNGQTELVEALLGTIRLESGSIIAGEKNLAKCNTKERRKFCSFIPEDRIKTGLSIKNSVHDNLIAVFHNKEEMKKFKLIDYKKTRSFAKSLIEKFDIRTAGQDISVSSLSGGNQQKIIVAREISLGNKILIAAQPSRGVDIGATRFIHEKLIQLRNEGYAILLVSTDLDEVYSLSDRIVVIFNGEIIAMLNPQEVEPNELGLYMTGSKKMNLQGAV